MGKALGSNLDAVRLHTDAQSAGAAQELNARAFTMGQHVYFGSDQYEPGTSAGRKLLAHELTHTVQQKNNIAVQPIASSNITVSQPGDPQEREAEAMSEVVAAGEGEAHKGQAEELLHEKGTGSGVHIQRQPAALPQTPPATPQQTPPATPQQTPPGATANPPATISQGPIGDVVIRLQDWVFLDPYTMPAKEWKFGPKEATFLTVPIPELGVGVNLGGSLSASASFNAGYNEGALRNIRIGLTRSQYAATVLANPFAGVIPFLSVPRALALLTFNDIRGLADLELGGFVRVELNGNAALKAAAKALGLFTVATLEGGLNARAVASFNLNFGGRLGLYFEDGHLRFRFDKFLDAMLAVDLLLTAYIKATLLGFGWHKQWPLLGKRLEHGWGVGNRFNLNYDNDPKTTFNISEQDFAFLDVVKQLWQEKENLNFGSLTNLASGGGAGGGGLPPGGGAGGGGTPPPGSAPTGRTPSNPIPMFWFKRPSLYPISIELSGDRYFFTEPEWLTVPDSPGLADVRRRAIDGKIRIGVYPSGEFYPRVGQVWPRNRVGLVRSGVRQREFRRLLRAHNFDWDGLGYEADHVRDLQWAEADADVYENLWPLLHTHNNAANRILDQIVTYQDASGVAHTVPLRDTPLRLWFRIQDYADP
jgi:hypothetical protein